MLRCTPTQIRAHSDSLLKLRLAHTQTRPHGPISLRLTSHSTCEDVSSEALASATQRGATREYFTVRSRPDCGDVFG
eukprot:9350206-Pyramimonas_sp.AAC.1